MKKKIIGLTITSILLLSSCGGEKPKSSSFGENSNTPTIVSKKEFSIKENQIEAFEIKAEDNTNVKYYIFGGDSELFEVNTITGKVRFKYPPDYESRISYEFTIIVEDSVGKRTEQNIKIHILDIDEIKEDHTPPVFDELKKEIIINENERGVFRAIARDDNEVSYEISGGNDASKFVIDPRTGVVKFVSSPSYNRQNTYHFTIIALDNQGNEGVQDVTLHIDNKLPINDDTSYTNYVTPSRTPSTELLKLVAYNDKYTHICMGPIIGNVLDNDIGVSDKVQVRLITSPQYSNDFTLNSNGSFNYTSIMMPLVSQNQDSFTYEVSTNGQTAIGTVLFNMNTAGQCQETIVPSPPPRPSSPPVVPLPVEEPVVTTFYSN